MGGWNELRERVFTAMRADPNRTQVTEADVDLWMQEALADLTTRLHLVQEEATLTFTDGAASLPEDCTDLITLKFATDDIAEWVNEDVFNLMVEEAGNPATSVYRIFNGQVEVYPVPTNGATAEARFWTTTDTSLAGITATLKTKIVNYARSHALLKIYEFDLADRYMAMYERGLPQPELRGQNRTGPLKLTPKAGPFETSDYTE